MDEFLLSEVKPKSVAILYVDNPFATPGAEESKARLEAAGVDVPVFEKFAITTTDFTTLIAQVKAAGVDVVKHIGYDANYVAYVQAARQAGLDVDVLYAETLEPFEPSNQTVLGDLSDNVIGDAYWYPGSSPDFDKAYEAKFGQKPDSKAAFGYAAAVVLLDAIARAGSSDAAAIQAALTETALDTPIGNITFDKDGENIGQIRLGQWRDGQIELIWPQEGATSDWKAWEN